MLHVKDVDDFEQIEDVAMRDWLKKENPFIPVKDGDSGFYPEDHGWLIVIDSGSSVEALDTGIEALDNLEEIECWEYATFNPAFDVWMAVVILSDGFGMAFVIPDSIVMRSSLRATLSAVAGV